MEKVEDLKQKLKHEETIRKAAEALLEKKTAELVTFQKNTESTSSKHITLTKRLGRYTNYLKVLNKFALEMSGIDTEEALIWYVVREVVGQLGFEDCVIYLLSTDKKTLIQKAAFGVKNPVEHTLINPLRITLGDGITGSVAESKKSEMINDVTLDDRYIIDINSTGSELCIPLIYEGDLLGVIDSENENTDYFGQEQLDILTTVSSMTSARLSEIYQKEKLRFAQKEAEKANQEKSRFLATMSHEIRTPVNGVLGSLNLMDLDDLESDQARLINVAISSAGLLKTLLDDILDLGKLEAGKIEVHTQVFDVRNLILQVFELFEPFAQTKNIFLKIDFHKDTPEMVESCVARIRQILVNYLSNAIKFTTDGTVTIGVKLSVSSPEKLHFFIKDTGVGVKNQDQDHIFDDFTQVGMGQRVSFEGAGIGLSISRRLAELMKGQVGVQSIIGMGSTFWLEVPFKASNEKVKISDNRRAPRSFDFKYPDGKKRRVLVAEDVSSNQLIIGELLKRVGFVVDMVGTGTEATIAARKRPYDVVLMDMAMPDMDGVEATKIIRSTIKSLPIIAVTAYNLKDKLPHLKSQGFNALVMKPIDEKELYEVLGKVLNVNSVNQKRNKIRSTDDKKNGYEGFLRKSLSAVRPKNYNKILGSLKMDLERDLKRLDENFHDKDLISLESCTHRLKGILGNCGASELVDLAGRVNGEIDQLHKAPLKGDVKKLLSGGRSILIAIDNLEQKVKLGRRYLDE